MAQISSGVEQLIKIIDNVINPTSRGGGGGGNGGGGGGGITGATDGM